MGKQVSRPSMRPAAETVQVTLASTEVIGGEKKRPGDKVRLPVDHPVAIKALSARLDEKADDASRE